jgi:hypothetical protein
MIDRYTKAVLTLIATALVYLCIVLTPWPGVQAQTTARPGESTGPAQVVIVGWRGAPGETVPVSSGDPLRVRVTDPLRIADPVQVTGSVTTRKADERADRVVLVGWEDGATRDGRPSGRLQTFGEAARGLPVVPR